MTRWRRTVLFFNPSSGESLEDVAGGMREEAKRGHNTLGKHKQPAGTLQTLLQRCLEHAATHFPQGLLSTLTACCVNIHKPNHSHTLHTCPALISSPHIPRFIPLHSPRTMLLASTEVLSHLPLFGLQPLHTPRSLPARLTRHDVACLHSRIQRRSHHGHCCRRRCHGPRCRRALASTAVTGVAALPVGVGQAARHRAGLIRVSRARTKRGIAHAWHALQVVVQVARQATG